MNESNDLDIVQPVILFETALSGLHCIVDNLIAEKLHYPIMSFPHCKVGKQRRTLLFIMVLSIVMPCIHYQEAR